MDNPTLEQATEVLSKFWGYPSFRTGQDQVIKSVLQGEDTLVLFPTGGGKSLCYQVPALLFDGVTVVISPLVALMQDQVDQLKKVGIRATFINSTLPGYEVEQRLVNARNGMYRLLYIAPERLSTDLWKREQPQLQISCVAIDEAHCISEWGHSFRPSYRRIREELRELPDSVRWIALTATATPEVREDILKNLEFSDPNVIAGGFGRENLKWWVNHTPQKKRNLLKAIKKASDRGSGILYCSTRRDCEQWAQNISREGISSEAYHAGLGNKTREQVQQRWLNGKTAVVVSTNAFGMGIDKADCRFVIHHTMPISLEAYYQEAGRAGRDGEEAFPLLFYKKGDAERARERILNGYPEYETLKKVYDGLCDEMELAVGSELEKPAAIRYRNIAKRTNVRERNVAVSVRVLERLGVIEKTELYKPRIGIRFTAGKNYIRSLVQDNSSKKMEFLDTIFRQFGANSFHEMTYIDESYICKKVNATPRQLDKALTLFANHDKLLEFEKLGEEPLIMLMEARMKTLEIDHKSAYHYRDVLLGKLDYMQQYVETSGCREQFLRIYFGETDAQPCGHCDNCLAKLKNTEHAPGEEEISRVRELIEHNAQSLEALVQETGLSGRTVRHILRLLADENYIEKVEEEGIQFRIVQKS
ncbi:MAG: RecQ family ATP-dependent DNA helicase [Balneolaceae bacterium]